MMEILKKLVGEVGELRKYVEELAKKVETLQKDVGQLKKVVKKMDERVKKMDERVKKLEDQQVPARKGCARGLSAPKNVFKETFWKKM